MYEKEAGFVPLLFLRLKLLVTLKLDFFYHVLVNFE